MTKNIFHLTGLTCVACKKISEKRISAIHGVSQVDVNVDSGEAVVRSAQPISHLEIESSLEGTPYRISN